MRISDWSSDVCSSDLPRVAATWGINVKAYTVLAFAVSGLFAGLGGAILAYRDTNDVANPFGFHLADRKSVVSGKSGSVRVDPGGSSIVQKNINNNMT